LPLRLCQWWRANSSKKKGENVKSFLAEVEELYEQQYASSPEQNTQALQIYQEWLNGVFPPFVRGNLHTEYHAREQLVNPLAIKW